MTLPRLRRPRWNDDLHEEDLRAGYEALRDALPTTITWS